MPRPAPARMIVRATKAANFALLQLEPRLRGFFGGRGAANRWLSWVLTWRSVEPPSPRLVRAGGLGRLVDSLSVGARTGGVSAATAAVSPRVNYNEILHPQG